MTWQPGQALSPQQCQLRTLLATLPPGYVLRHSLYRYCNIYTCLHSHTHRSWLSTLNIVFFGQLLHKYSVALENPLYFCVQMVFFVAVGLHNRNTVTVKTCQQHRTIKYITQTGFPSPMPLRGTYILCLVCCTGQHCIIKPLLLSWHIALHCFHESFMSTEWCRCQFEGHIITNFGQVADSASMIKNLGDGLKVRGL